MVLKPQDILVMLKLVVLREKSWTYNKLAIDLGMSPSEVHAAAKRALAAHLAVSKESRLVPNVRNLSEFLIHGLRYVFIPEWGEITRGMPTIFAAPPLNQVMSSSTEAAPVWPDPEGEWRGSSFTPLYKSVPKAARVDGELYELLVLVDAIRGGRARERSIAIKELEKRLNAYHA